MAATETDEIPIQGKLIAQKIIKSQLQIESLIQEIKKCDQDQSEMTKLNFSARKSILGIKSDLQVLEDIKEQEDDCNKKKIIENTLSRHKKMLMSLQVNLRKANLVAEQRLSDAERNELMSTPNKDKCDDATTHRRKKTQQKAVNVTSNITANLVKIAEMMSTQVEHGIESTKVLEDSSKQLTETQEELKGMAGVIQMSKKLISKYSRRELTDTLLIFFGLVLFFSTVVYVILKRI